MPTLQDVAQLAGVSTATVSRTLNTPELVELVTRDKVVAAITATGYSRNEAARSLAMRSSRTIGVITDNFASNYFATIMDETVDLLKRYDYYVIAESIGHDAGYDNIKKQKKAWQSLVNRQVESIIVLCTLLSEAELEEMCAVFPNTVIIGRPIASAVDRCITVDHYSGGRQAARHLLEKGHRNIAMITGPDTKMDAGMRSNGFIDELAANNINLPMERILTGNYTINSGAEVMRHIIKSSDNVTAIFAQNDNMAVGVVNACYEAGLSVPNQMSVIGFDNSPLATSVFPNLTTISQPLKSMSKSAATLALSLSKHKPLSANIDKPQIHFEPTLIERMSVADKNLTAH